MAFETFSRKSAALTKTPVIGIQKRGTFSLNAAAVALLRSPEEDAEKIPVEFLFDPDEKLVGIKRSKGDANAYFIRKQPKSESYLLTGRAFTQHYEIDTSTVRRYEVEMRDGMAIIDLKRPLGSAKGRGKGAAAADG